MLLHSTPLLGPKLEIKIEFVVKKYVGQIVFLKNDYFYKFKY